MHSEKREHRSHHTLVHHNHHQRTGDQYEEKDGKRDRQLKKDGPSVVEENFKKQQEELELQQAGLESLKEYKVQHDKIENAHYDLKEMSKLGDPEGKQHSRKHHKDEEPAQPITAMKRELQDLADRA